MAWLYKTSKMITYYFPAAKLSDISLGPSIGIVRYFDWVKAVYTLPAHSTPCPSSCT